jgi:hypothetical protein
MPPYFLRIRFALVFALVVAPGSRLTAGEVDFNRDIRPILSENCYHCHGPDKSTRKAKMRLDVREAALDKEAFVPGNPAESELLTRVRSTDPEEQMPPPDSHKKLTASQKDLLERWIAEGAEYQPHWAYIVPQRPAVPSGDSQAGPAHPVDAFIQQPLRVKGVNPSPEADPRTLLRRLTLDLIGLPPTPAEVAAFLADSAPGAYERAVDRLLASPHYGERMAVPWLDVVRYADTVGYHGDQNANVFPYRDYVIAAFNQNKPFDQFTVEQIAGDLLPNATDEQRVATCFNRLNMMTREGGAQPKEYLTKYAADRVRTVSGAWLGSTMGCAECHDHKFDPFSAKDFYAMAAFFADVKQWGVYNDYSYTPNPDLKGFSNDHPFPPEIEVTSAYLIKRQEQLRERQREIVAAAGRKMSEDVAMRSGFETWRRASAGFVQTFPNGWESPTPEITLSAAAPAKAGKAKKPEVPVAADVTNPSIQFQLEDDGRVVIEPKAPARIALQMQPQARNVAALRVELLPHARHAGSILRAGAKVGTLKVALNLKRGGSDKSEPVELGSGEANFKQPRYANGDEVLGLKDGWALASAHTTDPCSAIWILAKPLALAPGDRLSVTLEGVSVGCVRVSISPFAPQDFKNPAADAKLVAALQREDSADAGVRMAWLRSTGADAAAFQQLTALEHEIAECRGGRAKVLVTEAVTPQPTRVLPRGNWQDESGDLLAPAAPHFLPQPTSSEGQRLNRLDLARWIVSAENPLTARVFANRLWKQFFGAGLSSVVDDLGAQGESPSHPELLDWLAVEFRESGWNVKHLVKLIVTSATYRQDANLRPELRDIDPNNRLLASQNPRRLEAESVRDNALAIAGLLNLELGGPPARPYQPAKYYENLQFPSREYEPHLDDRQFRRGVYTHWQRTFLHPMLANFDAPSREECTAARTVANTPQQALTLLNDPTFMEASRVFAARLLADAPTDTQRLGLGFETALARAIKPREQESLSRFLAAQREYYEAHPDDAAKVLRIGVTPADSQTAPAELAAWTMVARVVLNLHETITRY